LIGGLRLAFSGSIRQWGVHRGSGASLRLCGLHEESKALSTHSCRTACSSPHAELARSIPNSSVCHDWHVFHVVVLRKVKLLILCHHPEAARLLRKATISSFLDVLDILEHFETAHKIVPENSTPKKTMIRTILSPNRKLYGCRKPNPIGKFAQTCTCGEFRPKRAGFHAVSTWLIVPIMQDGRADSQNPWAKATIHRHRLRWPLGKLV